MDESLELAQEASHIAEFYTDVIKLITPVKDFIPYTWISLVSLKVEYYTALSHSFCGIELVKLDSRNITSKTLSKLKDVHRMSEEKLLVDIQTMKNENEKNLLG